MKRYLILSALGACTIGQAGTTPAPRPIAPMPVAGTRSTLSQAPTPVAKPDAGPRHLSEAERAELRQQLQQFNRQYGKRQ
jgi:hypothetical protein